MVSVGRIVWWTVGIVVVAFVVAVTVPAFHGYSPRKADKDAMTALWDTLLRAAASLEAHQNLHRGMSAGHLTKGGSNIKDKTRPDVLIRACKGIRQNVTIPAYDPIRPSFELLCPPGISMHIAIIARGFFAAAAHVDGGCIFVGNSVAGSVQRSNPDCRIETPDWKGQLPDGIVEQRLLSHLAEPIR